MKPKILVVDDHGVARAMVIRFLGPDYDFVEAASGDEALKVLGADHEVRLVLCDYMMPGINGMEFLRRKASIPGKAEVPVIIVTSIRDDKAITQAESLGAAQWVLKPFTAQVLKDAVTNALKMPRGKP
jgi:CheY-like chemotaxis protein